MLPLFLVAFLQAAPGVKALPLESSAEVERRALQHVRAAFEVKGRRVPTADEALHLAAQTLAAAALEAESLQAVDLLTLTRAVSDAGGWAPSPRSYLVRAASPSELLATFEARAQHAEEAASQVGVGSVIKGSRSALVMLLSERKATLKPFPRKFARAGEQQKLCGSLEEGFRAPQIYVTQPDGSVERPALVQPGPASFCSLLTFAKPGSYAVELLGQSERGPEVLALFLVDVGQEARRTEAEPIVEPTSLLEGRRQVLARINALRRAHGVAALAPDPSLDEVAQRYSERMAKEGFFAHLSPEGTHLRHRLDQGGVRYSNAGENLGLAPGPLAAHFGIEHSPGHRQNLLTPGFTHAGLGIAVQKREGRDQVILTQVFASLVAEGKEAPLEVAYRAVDTQRANQHLPVLHRNAALEAVALAHAQRALSLDQPQAELPGSRVHERIFQALPEAQSASVDLFVAEDPAQVPLSRSLAQTAHDQVGIGVVRGDSQTYGKGRYWVVILYAASR